MNSPSDPALDVGRALIRTSPPFVVWTLTLSDVVAIATVAYIALQAAYLIWKWCRQAELGTPGDD